MLALAGILTIVSHTGRRLGRRLRICFALLLASPFPSAAEIAANPTNYRVLLRKLEPGDTLKLAAGTYPRLRIDGVNGEPDAWITISGPQSGPPAVIQAAIQETIRADVIDINNSSYLAIENLRIDSRGIEGAFGIAAHGHQETSRTIFVSKATFLSDRMGASRRMRFRRRRRPGAGSSDGIRYSAPAPGCIWGGRRKHAVR
jgi:hypothetical protein